MNARWKFFFRHWKLGIHLIFRTKRFGVNNKRWCHFDSIFGWSNWKKFICVLLVRPIIRNYTAMKYRAGVCHFMNDESYRLCFGADKQALWQKGGE